MDENWSCLKKNIIILSDLCDGKVQADINDDSEEEDVEGPYNQERLLQHQDLIKVVMNLVKEIQKHIRSNFVQFKRNKKSQIQHFLELSGGRII